MEKIEIKIKDNKDKTSCNVEIKINPSKSGTKTEQTTALAIREKILNILNNLSNE